MGYCVSMDINVTIPGKNVSGALTAIRELMLKANTLGGGGGRGPDGVQVRWYSWVDTEDVIKAVDKNDLIEVLNHWRYEATSDSISPVEELAEQKADIVVVCFTGEKLGDDSVLWEALAPFVDSDSYIECTGEDEARWKYSFTNGEFSSCDGVNIWRGSKDDPIILHQRVADLEEELFSLKFKR